MALTPKWNEPPGLKAAWGFDDTTTRPPWFLVGLGSSKALYLDFAAGMKVKSVHSGIAVIHEEMMDQQSRVFMIEGKNLGRVHIEVRDPGTKSLLSILLVSVKQSIKMPVNFHFVEDHYGNKPVTKQGIVSDLIDNLNEIYDNQTNLSFELGYVEDLKESDLKIRGGLPTDTVWERVDGRGQEVQEHHYAGGKSFWKEVAKKLSKRYYSQYIDVFFVPADLKTVNINNVMLYTDSDTRICVTDADPRSADYLIPVGVGSALGCPFSDKMNELMFWDGDIRKTFMSRSQNWIPRADAEILNP